MDVTPKQEARGHRRLHRSHRLVAVGVVAALAVPLLVRGADASGSNDEAVDPVLMWNAIAGDAAVTACIAPVNNPFHESRMYAMTHIAVHDALNSIDRRSRPYAFSGRDCSRMHRRRPRWLRPPTTCSS